LVELIEFDLRIEKELEKLEHSYDPNESKGTSFAIFLELVVKHLVLVLRKLSKILEFF
jgi:hypothetical protein